MHISTQIIGRVVSLVFNLYDCLFISHKAWILEDDSNKGLPIKCRRDADGNVIQENC
jgi:hypothetical protein